MDTLRLAVVSAGLLVLAAAAPAVAAEEPATATYVTGTITETFGPPPETVEGAEAGRLTMVTESEVDWSDPRLPARMVSRAFLDSYEGAHPDGALWPSMNTSSHRLEGLDGAWSGFGHGFAVNPGWMPSEPTELMGVELITLASRPSCCCSSMLSTTVRGRPPSRASSTRASLRRSPRPSKPGSCFRSDRQRQLPTSAATSLLARRDEAVAGLRCVDDQSATLGPPGISPSRPAQAQFLTASKSFTCPTTSLITYGGDVEM
jgi:hypothetical protein